MDEQVHPYYSIGKIYCIDYKHRIHFDTSDLEIVTLIDVVSSPIGEYFEVLFISGEIKKFSTDFYALREI